MQFDDNELIDIVKKWVKDNGRLPNSKDFTIKNGLFSHTTLECYFDGMKNLFKMCGFTDDADAQGECVATVTFQSENCANEEPKKFVRWIVKRVEKPLCNGYLDARCRKNKDLLRKE